MNRIISILTLAVCFSVWAEAQTIADVARQERAKRQSNPSRIVITNETLKVMGSPAAALSDKSPAEEEKTAAPPGGARDETYWRAQFKQARENAKRAEDLVTVAQLELNRANLALLQQSDIYNKENRVYPEITERTASLAAAKDNLEKARQRLSALEEDFRRSGAPAGWSR